MATGSITRYVHDYEVTHRILRLEGDTVVFQDIATLAVVAAARNDVSCLQGPDRDLGHGYMCHCGRWYRGPH